MERTRELSFGTAPVSRAELSGAGSLSPITRCEMNFRASWKSSFYKQTRFWRLLATPKLSRTTTPHDS